MPFVVTCALKTHRANGRGRGKPVLIYILACSLGFHAITLMVRNCKGSSAKYTNLYKVDSVRTLEFGAEAQEGPSYTRECPSSTWE